MGVDYVARKRGKKNAKRMRSDSSEFTDSERRIRQKPAHKRIRKICKGACYSAPPLPPSLRNVEVEDEELSVRKQKRQRVEEKRKAAAERLSAVGPPESSAAAPQAATVSPRPSKPGEVLAEGEVPNTFNKYLSILKYAAPTAVQDRCWEAAVLGRDMLVIAPPGSGKTLAYLLPGARHAARAQVAPMDAEDGGFSAVCAPAALVLVPTRELAVQVMAAGKYLRKLFRINACVVYGGAPLEDQLRALEEKAPPLLIATPGRVTHLLRIRRLDLSGTDFVAMDEADKMMTLGFEEQLAAIREALPQKRQNLFLSATFPPTVAAMAKIWLRNPKCLRVNSSSQEDAQEPTAASHASEPGGAKSGGASVPSGVVETVHVCAEHKKSKKLLKFLDKEVAEAKAKGQRNLPRFLVFANRISTVKFICDLLKKHQHRTALLHGKQPQGDRERALQEFKAGKVTVLVATDVAGRGIHIQGLPHYVHRVGRTGRAGAAGSAFTFFTRNFAAVAPDLVQRLKAASQEMDPNLVALAAIAVKAGIQGKAQLSSIKAAERGDDEEMEEGEDDATEMASENGDEEEGEEDDEDGEDNDDEEEEADEDDGEEEDEEVAGSEEEEEDDDSDEEQDDDDNADGSDEEEVDDSEMDGEDEEEEEEEDVDEQQEKEAMQSGRSAPAKGRRRGGQSHEAANRKILMNRKAPLI
ncbi:hypothetical protein CYMTET_24579 [Cymbomonas tetramitiformis]|uniref:DEAD/DEAH box helicase domain-containing protein n=1 Tax=Cymbomonas tetramitiformis TaxID=36881 RepID=A0AAE0FWB3_9CHLO|nr:hypothetical protein CYMTET_24579 [Cymbomonas tetramitiformis]